jgi:hypothetical protein
MAILIFGAAANKFRDGITAIEAAVRLVFLIKSFLFILKTYDIMRSKINLHNE